MKKSILLWLIAFLLTVLTAVYQRVTGPTYPVSGEVMIDGSQIEYKIASILMFIIFLIPHSVLGSELDYNELDSKISIENLTVG